LSSISEKENHLPIAAYEGVEIGAVSIKWVRRNQNNETSVEYISHGGDPEKILRRIINACRLNYPSMIVACG